MCIILNALHGSTNTPVSAPPPGGSGSSYAGVSPWLPASMSSRTPLPNSKYSWIGSKWEPWHKTACLYAITLLKPISAMWHRSFLVWGPTTPDWKTWGESIFFRSDNYVPTHIPTRVPLPSAPFPSRCSTNAGTAYIMLMTVTAQSTTYPTSVSSSSADQYDTARVYCTHTTTPSGYAAFNFPLAIKKITSDAPLSTLSRSDFIALTFCDQKNAVHG